MKNYFLAAALLLILSLNGPAQSFDLEAFLNKADLATVQYQKVFKNLVAEEFKIYDYYRQDGTLEETRKIKSIFVVYQSPKTNLVAEFRNVVEFNGKDVARGDNDIAKLFDKLSKANSSGEEISRLTKEGNRFDGRSHAFGMTLLEAFLLNWYFRPFFEFQIVGRETVDGHETIIVEYKQTQPSSLIKTNATDEERKKEPKGINFDTELAASFQPTNPRLNGKLWLDAETARLWKNEFTVSIQPAMLSKRIVSSEFLYEYQTSDFGILLPKRFVMTAYRFMGRSEKEMSKTKASIKVFEYSKFTKPDSEIKESKTGN